ncbi:MAG: DNA repair protein RecO [Cyanobacteria bacterium P01_G01_bin.4]
MGNRRLYRATGINLKVTPLGEADRIVTILTDEYGLVRAVAPGARKQKTQLGGNTELFAINELVLVEGRSLDRISQADRVQSLPYLRSSLTRLTVAQYWAEVVLYQALSDQPQRELFLLLVEHLERLERSSSDASALPLLVHGLYHLLAIAGIAPQVRPCSDCPGTHEWSFSPDGGGVACHHCIGSQRPMQRAILTSSTRAVLKLLPRPQLPDGIVSTGAGDLHLSENRDLQKQGVPELKAWRTVERLLRKSLHYHFDRDIQSAQLVDDCFADAIAAQFDANAVACEPNSLARERVPKRVAEAGGGLYG